MASCGNVDGTTTEMVNKEICIVQILNFRKRDDALEEMLPKMGEQFVLVAFVDLLTRLV